MTYKTRLIFSVLLFKFKLPLILSILKPFIKLRLVSVVYLEPCFPIQVLYPNEVVDSFANLKGWVHKIT